MRPLRPQRILLSAFACSPSMGSEEYVGWQWARMLARDHEVWVLTEPHWRPSIEEAIEVEGISSLHPVYVDLPPLLRRVTGAIRLRYVLWQLRLIPLVRRLHRQVGFDFAQQLTYNTIEVPGWLCTAGAPFIWGPVGGAQVPPSELRSYFGRGWTRERLRGVRKLLARFNPLNRHVVRHARLLLAANRDSDELLRAMGARAVTRELETAITSAPERAEPTPRGAEPFTVLWAGSVEPRKAPTMALDVLTRLRERGVDAHLRYAGDGPWLGRLRGEIELRGLNEVVHVEGRLAFSEMPDFYERGHAFLFTSLRDTSGNVMLEAMARGLPVVALDHQGAVEIVAEDGGCLVPVGPPARVVDAMAGALEQFALDEERRIAAGRGALAAAERQSWERKRERIRVLLEGLRVDDA